ncbi:tyrosine-type recombinase/integrase [Rhodovulum sulfidophilum]|uniref:tyrosine-type recombinase/integrase n=1 Tax=Rhodovulum sulfidophilum TaxID=35806 RepID=UPI001A5A8DEA|nr:tyrosine-type recombinase/integrase [Rhodovulum sulfidophilum]MBL3576370.1 tyrosine-type recombinase/integrase [Rhodovulum sulfidophilum]
MIYIAFTPERSGDYIIAKSPTEPLGPRQVQAAIAEVRAAIGVMHGKSRLVPHGSRYTAAKQLADAGCSVQMIQAVTGHSSLAMALKYSAGADRTRLAKQAQDARDRSLEEQEQRQDETETCETDCEILSQPPIRKRRKGKNDKQFQNGAGGGTRTPTPKAPEPKSPEVRATSVPWRQKFSNTKQEQVMKPENTLQTLFPNPAAWSMCSERRCLAPRKP